MKLAIVHDWLTGMRGGEKCLEIICRRFPGADLYTLLHQKGTTSPAIERMRIRTSFLQRFPGIGRYYRWTLPLMPRAVERLRLPGDADLVLSFSSAVAKSVRVPPGVPHVCYCFSPMRYAWHLRGHYDPSIVRGGLSHGGLRHLPQTLNVAARNLALDRIRRWDQQTSRRVTHFVAVSRTIADRIADCYGRDSTVIHPPVDDQFYTPARVPREDYYLCLSALVPYKRIDLAIEACNRMGRRLVVIGSGPLTRRLRRMAGPTIEFLGWTPGDAIRDYLRRCRALLFPGLEDFGIVPLEAQACGAPVIAFGRGGATESLLSSGGDTPGTGIFFQRQTVEDLSAAMARFEDRPHDCCPQLARRQAERHNVANFERQLLDLLDQVHQQSGRSSDRTVPPVILPFSHDSPYRRHNAA